MRDKWIRKLNENDGMSGTEKMINHYFNSIYGIRTALSINRRHTHSHVTAHQSVFTIHRIQSIYVHIIIRFAPRSRIHAALNWQTAASRVFSAFFIDKFVVSCPPFTRRSSVKTRQSEVSIRKSSVDSSTSTVDPLLLISKNN